MLQHLRNSIPGIPGIPGIPSFWNLRRAWCAAAFSLGPNLLCCIHFVAGGGLFTEVLREKYHPPPRRSPHNNPPRTARH